RLRGRAAAPDRPRRRSAPAASWWSWAASLRQESSGALDSRSPVAQASRSLGRVRAVKPGSGRFARRRAPKKNGGPLRTADFRVMVLLYRLDALSGPATGGIGALPAGSLARGRTTTAGRHLPLRRALAPTGDALRRNRLRRALAPTDPALRRGLLHCATRRGALRRARLATRRRRLLGRALLRLRRRLARRFPLGTHPLSPWLVQQ